MERPSAWVEEEAQQQEGFGLRSPDWRKENSSRDWLLGQPPHYSLDWEVQAAQPEVEGMNWQR